MPTEPHLLDINISCDVIISYEDLKHAVDEMKCGKQAGEDTILAESLESIWPPGSDACNWILILFQLILNGK